MSLIREVARVNANVEGAGRVAEFVSGVRYLMLKRGGAAQSAERDRAPDRVVEFVKAPQAAGSMTGWGSPLAPFQSLATAFLSSLSAVSAFDALWPSMLQVPLRTHVVSVSATITSTSISEGSVKPASQISLTASDLDVVKCAAFVAVSSELLRSGTPGALAVLQTELRTAIARCTNSVFLPILTASAPSFPSSGVAGSGVRQDLRTLLANVNSGSASKLYLITGRTIAEALAVLPDTAGGPAFPLATVAGGSIGGIPIVVCDEATAGEIILVDASQVAAGTEGLVLNSADQASLQLDTVGDSPPTSATNLISLWQLNLLALRAERFIGAKVLRSDAVAKITGVGYTGGSPA